MGFNWDLLELDWRLELDLMELVVTWDLGSNSISIMVLQDTTNSSTVPGFILSHLFFSIVGFNEIGINNSQLIFLYRFLRSWIGFFNGISFCSVFAFSFSSFLQFFNDSIFEKCSGIKKNLDIVWDTLYKLLNVNILVLLKHTPLMPTPQQYRPTPLSTTLLILEQLELEVGSEQH